MQRRSWMAALTLATLAGAFTGPSTGAEEPTSVKQTVAMKLYLSGLKYPGEIVIKPGSPGSRFKPFTQAIKNNDRTDIKPFEVEVFSADRDCAFLITLKEPGQPDKTFRRHVRIVPPGAAKSSGQEFVCSLSASSFGQAATIAEKTADETKTKQ